jgi:PHD/YefM family antitoxin component YafN of YafNO toxin-antitoxin module
MGILQKQYIKDDKGAQVGVILAIAEYEALMERLEELEDIIAYDKAKAEPSDAIPFSDFLKQLKN